MPSLELVTNVKIPDTKAFVIEFSKVSAEILSKPERSFATNVSYNEHLSFSGSFEPAFTLNITSLDNLNEEANKKFSKSFFDFFEKKLGIPDDRGYITFVDPGKAYLGYKGTTIATLVAGKA